MLCFYTAFLLGGIHLILELKHLLLEVTRQCNMACRHCMRGDAENLSMSDTIIDRIFRDTRKIGHLCLTGGEPSLAPRVIMEILYRPGGGAAPSAAFSAQPTPKPIPHSLPTP